METRTRNLSLLLGLSVGAVVFLLGANLWFDENARLDSEFASLQTKVARALSQARSGSTGPQASSVVARLRAKDQAPSLVPFAAQVRAGAMAAGLSVEDFSMKEEAGKEGMVHVKMSGTMGQWFLFQSHLQKTAGPLVFRSLTFEAADRAQYHISQVVGYAFVP